MTPRHRAGWLLLAAALLANPLTLAALASDGRVESWWVNAAVVLLDCVCVALGASLVRSSRARPLETRLLLLATALVFAVTIGEGALRAAGVYGPLVRHYPGELADRPSENFVSDPATGWRMWPERRFFWTIDGTPQSYVADADGFRTYEAIERRRDFDHAERRVVAIGDSFTFGTGVAYEETFPSLIEASAPDLAVKNMAMPGFGLDQMWATLASRALPLSPALAIVGFIDEDLDRSLTAYNLSSAMSKPTFTVRDGVLSPLRADDEPAAFRRSIEQGSWLLSAVRRALRGVADLAPMDDWWIVNRALFRAMQESAAAAGVPLVFVRLPLRRPHAWPVIDREMARMHAVYLDLSRAPAGPSIHFVTDDHINARGHRWVAERILALPTVRAALASSVAPGM